MNQERGQMEELLAYRVDLLAALEAVASQLSQAVARLPDKSWHQSIGPGSATPHFLLFLMHELEAQVFSPNLLRMINEDRPTLPAFDQEAWMAGHYAMDKPVANLLDEFGKLRHHELDWLRKLPPQGWSRLARHPWWGMRTLQWWVELQLDYSNQPLRALATKASGDPLN
jgi:hypothetical protein